PDRPHRHPGLDQGPGPARERRVALGETGWVRDAVVRAKGGAGGALHVDPGHDLERLVRRQQPRVDAEGTLELRRRRERLPRAAVADDEQVAVSRDGEREPVLLLEAEDHRDAREREADVHLARELVSETARARAGGAG